MRAIGTIAHMGLTVPATCLHTSSSTHGRGELHATRSPEQPHMSRDRPRIWNSTEESTPQPIPVVDFTWTVQLIPHVSTPKAYILTI